MLMFSHRLHQAKKHAVTLMIHHCSFVALPYGWSVEASGWEGMEELEIMEELEVKEELEDMEELEVMEEPEVREELEVREGMGEAEEAFRQWGREALVKHARQKLEEWKGTPVHSCKKCLNDHNKKKYIFF